MNHSETQIIIVDCQKQWFDEWEEQVQRDLGDESSGLALQLKGRLMEVEKDDHTLRVNYSSAMFSWPSNVNICCFLLFLDRNLLHTSHS